MQKKSIFFPKHPVHSHERDMVLREYGLRKYMILYLIFGSTPPCSKYLKTCTVLAYRDVYRHYCMARACHCSVGYKLLSSKDPSTGSIRSPAGFGLVDCASNQGLSHGKSAG